MWRTSNLHVLKNPRPLVMAHRGNSAEIPENTREAFEDAARMKGVDVIETDVHVTRDDNLVFFHDPIVNRTTNGRGKIKDKTLAELKALDAGFHHEDPSGNHPFRGKGFTIQSVDEILSAFPDQRFNIDIKSRDPRAPSMLARKLDSLGIENGPGSRVLVASFWDAQIKRFRDMSSIPTSASTIETFGFRNAVNKWYKHHGTSAIPSRIPQENVLGKEVPYIALQIPERLWFLTVIGGKWFIDITHALGIAVEVWTINEPEPMRRLLGWGVDGIFSDQPAALITVMDELFPKART